MKTIKIPAVLNELEHVRKFADEVLTDTVASKEEQMAIELAIEEIFVNIVKYSQLPKTAMIMVSYEYDNEENAVVIQFEDEGYPFNPLEMREPDITAELSERAPGGLGIYMLKKMMDYVEYEYIEGTNKLLICKRFAG